PVPRNSGGQRKSSCRSSRRMDSPGAPPGRGRKLERSSRAILLQTVFQGLPEPRTELRIGQGEVQEGLEIALEVADVVAMLPRRKPEAHDLLAVVQKQSDGISQLHLPLLVGQGPFEGLVNGG